MTSPAMQAAHPATSQKTPQKGLRHAVADQPTPAATTPRSVPTPHAPFLSPSASRTGVDVSAQKGRSPRPFGTPSKSTGLAGFTPGLAGKSLFGSGKTPAGTGNSFMFQSSPPSGSSSSDSPSAMMALDSNGATSAPMGMSMSNLGLGLGLGVGMGLSTSVQSTGSGKLDDAERRRRLEAVSNMVGTRPSRISQEGVERLARQFFQEVDKEEGNGPDANMTFIMGGNTVGAIIHFENKSSSIVEGVELQFHDLPEALNEHADSGAVLLKEDLSIPNTHRSINANLEKFANNLERLSRMDKLGLPGANCFEAVAGVHTSLQRLFDHERRMADVVLESGGTSLEHIIEKEVLCRKSGRPRMHAHGRLGLSLDYWQEGRLVDGPTLTQTPKDETFTPTVAQQGNTSKRKIEAIDESRAHSLTIECERCAPGMYPSIRVTDEWLSEAITRERNDSELLMESNNDRMSDAKPQGRARGADSKVLDWLDPPFPLISGVEPNPPSINAGDDPSASSQSQARFVASLEPPITLPLHLAMQVFASVDVDISQEALMTPSATSWDAIVFPQDVTDLTDVEHDVGMAFTSRHLQANHEQLGEAWKLNLYVPPSSRSVAARTIHSLPFSHPKQIIELLPVLRQWAFLTSLLQRTFPSKINDNSPPSESRQPEDRGDPVSGAAQSTIGTEDAALLDDLLAEDSDEQRAPPRVLDISLHIPQPPRYAQDGSHDFAQSLETHNAQPALTFTIPRAGGLARIKLEIGLDAEISCSLCQLTDSEGDRMAHNDVGGGEDVDMTGDGSHEGQTDDNSNDKDAKLRANLAKGLAISEDLAMWVEWVRQKVLKLD